MSVCRDVVVWKLNTILVYYLYCIVCSIETIGVICGDSPTVERVFAGFGERLKNHHYHRETLEIFAAAVIVHMRAFKCAFGGSARIACARSCPALTAER